MIYFFNSVVIPPSKWGLQQQAFALAVIHFGCDNPSEWGLQQQKNLLKLFFVVVITPQNGVFNNT